MKLGSFRTRVISWYIGMLALALVAFSGSIYFGIGEYLRLSLEKSLKQRAQGIATELLPETGEKGNGWLAAGIEGRYYPETSGHIIRVSRGDGAVLYQSQVIHDPTIDPSRVSHLPAGQTLPSFRMESLDGIHPLVVYALPYTAPDGTSYVVEVGAPRGRYDHILRGFLFTLMFATPLILLLAVVSGYLLLKQPLKPIAALTQQAECIGAENLSERMPVLQTGDELERLALALNRMLTRLEDAVQHIHRFSEDVSHELRTPLTIMRGELESAAQIERTNSEVAGAIWSSIEEIERLSRIVNNLLVLSRLDYDNAGMEMRVVNLSALVGDTTEQMRVLAQERDIEIACDLRPVTVLGEAGHLRQVAVNLLDNAIKYTRDGGHIDVRVRKDGNLGVFEVADNGIGIAARALPHIFERFYRTDRARSRASGGSGLGLSIVRAICSAHGGDVNVQSEEGHGTTMTVRLLHCAAEALNGEQPAKEQDITASVVA